MHVIATAGHVDHGKSTLVRALTGMEADRWAEEQRRGMTIDLGFAWTTFASGRTVAFVDVPGHERFVSNMLAGVGPAPMILLAVAADEGWMAQTDEHMRVVAALGQAQVLLVITKCDVASPDAVRAHSLAQLDSLGLPAAAVVEVSAVTGAGLDELCTALETFVAANPAPALDAPVRLWVDRSFTIRGAGTVVTGTLAAGRIKVGDTLLLTPGQRWVEVRALQALQQEHAAVEAPARVAVNLRAIPRDELRRGMALVTGRAWTMCEQVDVVGVTDELPDELVVHVGSAAVPAHRRRLGPGAARLRLRDALPLHVRDRLLLRDPASRRVAGVDVADLHPPPLTRRGDAARIGNALQVPATAQDLVTRREVCSVNEVVAAGLDPDAAADLHRVGEWLVSPARWIATRDSIAQRVAGHSDPFSSGLGVAAVARELDLPAPDIVTAIAAELPDVRIADGRLHSSASSGSPSTCLDDLLRRLEKDPFDAPDRDELAALELHRGELARAAREGLLVRLAEGIYVGATALAEAGRLLAGLPQPFSVSDARTRLGSSRRVVVPLLEQLDAARITRRLPDGQRVVVRSEA